MNLIQDKDREKRIKAAIHLAKCIQNEANTLESKREKEVARLVQDPKGKILAVELTDQSFRSSNSKRAWDQMLYLLNKHGMPSFLSPLEKAGVSLFRKMGEFFPFLVVPLAKKIIFQKTAHVIIPEKNLDRHLQLRHREGIRVNLNHLGEAILGEEEAKERLSLYLEDLKNPDVDTISVKVSTLYSQINLLDWENTLSILSERYKKLLMGTKFVNLDMEEYKDLRLTISLFKKVLEEHKEISAGIVLQSYLPDSFGYLQELTEFALKRKGAPIKIRIVKGANLAMEKVEASLKGWPLAPYSNKKDVDANFKKMLEYAFQKEHIEAVKIGVGSHNLFDIAYASVLAHERDVYEAVTFEMLEGMGESVRKVVQNKELDLLLYCPVARPEQFQNAVAYLIRRLDENTGPENYLRVAFDLVPGSLSWESQVKQFQESVRHIDHVQTEPHRGKRISSLNEPDTDFSLAANLEWGGKLFDEWKNKVIDPIPLVINGKEILDNPQGKGIDPSRPSKVSYLYQMASSEEVNDALDAAMKPTSNYKIAEKLREGRGKLIGAMLKDVGKVIQEADPEVSEAIDFAEYYQKCWEELTSLQEVQFKPKGIVFVASPWNFPASIAAGGIIAALITGNAVIFKPAPEAVLVGYTLAKLFWEAGVPKNVLQFVPCSDEIASLFVKDARVNTVLLTGATATAMHLYHLKPGLDLVAETGGKNSLIVTALADRDLAIKDIVQSAFGYSGQKCSACSVAILEAEVFDDPGFKRQLKDAVMSLSVGSAYNKSTKVNPLIRPPSGALLAAMQEEEWLLKPSIDKDNPHLMSPGIRWNVKPGSFIHQNELFGPILSVIRAEHLSHAIEIANATPFGLTAGIHSLDEREHAIWLKNIIAGNCYINRGITGAIVGRQPFGGTKKSSFGPSLKAGGPNYLLQLMHVEQAEVTDTYQYYWDTYFSKDHDPMHLLGQINIQRYVPNEHMVLRVLPGDSLKDVLKVIKAAKICGTPLKISVHETISLLHTGIKETDEEFLMHLKQDRIRLLSLPTQKVVDALSLRGLWQLPKPVVSNGRIELLHYLREVSISYDYHRYGNLGVREK